MENRLIYQVDDCPPPGVNLAFGLQWLAISVTSVIIMGKVVAGIHFTDLSLQLIYMQKLFFVMGLSLLVQLFWGHGLPLVIGPATALIVGIIAGMGRGIDAIYTSIALGGVFLFVLGVTGLFSRLNRLFTSRVVASILMLIALSITPVIVKLVSSCPSAAGAPAQVGFALVFLLIILAGDQHLKGMWKATMLVWAILGGSLVIHYIMPSESTSIPGQLAMSMNFFQYMITSPTWDPGLFLAFLICMIALSINDLGSIHAVGGLVKAQDMDGRVKKGISMTGVFNVLSGWFGVIGPVNFSLSAGIIASSGNGSRFPLIPAALGMILLAFAPKLVAFMWNIPDVVVGTVLLYVMSAQLSAGFMVAFENKSFTFQDGMVLGVPAMVCIVISYLTPSVKEVFPQVLIPILANGFVVGVVTVLILEHLVCRDRNRF